MSMISPENPADQTQSDLAGSSLSSSFSLASLLTPKAERVLALTRHEGPRCVRSLGVKLNIDEASIVCQILSREGISIRPFDFPGTLGVWSARNEVGQYYYREATATLLEKFSSQIQSDSLEQQDVRSVAGFKAVLGSLTYERMSKEPLNNWGTTLSGMMARLFKNSPSACVLELIENDPSFSAIRDAGLKIWDFAQVPANFWKASDNQPGPNARRALRELIERIAEEENVSPYTVEGFRTLLPAFSRGDLFNRPINVWGTTLLGLAAECYSSSPSRAVLDLVENDPAFGAIKDAGLSSYDFEIVPRGTWQHSEVDLRAEARPLVVDLIFQIGKFAGVDPATPEGFKKILPVLIRWSVEQVSVNNFGLKLKRHIKKAYGDSASEAFFDAIENEPRLSLIKAKGIERSDLELAPANHWKTSAGIPTAAARQATKNLILTLAGTVKVDCFTVEGFRVLLPDLIQNNFNNVSYNYWGTTCNGMLQCAYDGSTARAVLDLIDHDSEFGEIRAAGIESFDFNLGKFVWVDESGSPTDTARSVVRRLIEQRAEELGLDMSKSHDLVRCFAATYSRHFKFTSLNVWGTTAHSAFAIAYQSSPKLALIDLVSHDPDFGKFADELMPSLISR